MENSKRNWLSNGRVDDYYFYELQKFLRSFAIATWSGFINKPNSRRTLVVLCKALAIDRRVNINIQDIEKTRLELSTKLHKNYAYLLPG